LRRYYPDDKTTQRALYYEELAFLRHHPRNPRARTESPTVNLAEKVRTFISEAQLNYRAFFSSREPDLFPRILQHLTDRSLETVSAKDMLTRLEAIKQQDENIARFGLEPDRWSFKDLQQFVRKAGKRPKFKSALNALSAYIEVLESRAAERMLVASRLLVFERLMAEFFEAKRVCVDARAGLNIVTDAGMMLSEDKLSSGEFHLLYLMVAALTTKRRGTIIAIDEPEMSMHISWQRKLIRALVTCASGAEPQFIFATHSPDIAAEFEQQMVCIPNA
jgi:AAA domain, putative AbiEii toxin, Type IV TA system